MRASRLATLSSVALSTLAFASCGGGKPAGSTTPKGTMTKKNPTPSPTPSPTPTPSPSPAKLTPADAFLADCKTELQAAKQLLPGIVAKQATRTVANTVQLYNDLAVHLENASARAGLWANVHPDKLVRDAAEECEREVASYATELSLNRDLYDAFAAIDTKALDAIDRRFVELTLRDFRRSGVDKDEATRKRITALQDELVQTGQEFGKNMREDVRSIALDDVASLKGLPQDYIDAHPKGADGKIKITTDYPDYIPFMTYADDGAARQALYKEFRKRGYPANIKVLDQLLAKRYELANLLGYKTWADYITEDKMIKSAKAVDDFINKVSAASKARAKVEYADLLKEKKKDDKKATFVGDYEKGYYEERVKKAKLKFDSQSVRPYFEYSRVRAGLLEITGKLFDLSYKEVKNAEVWAPDVDVYDVYRGDEKLGRIYLDMHPREGKYKHAAQFTLRSGLAGSRLPEGVLVCNFPAPPADPSGPPALMEHDDVVTMFHEFGHLIHHVVGGKQRWLRFSGVATEHDFVEAPSQLLEEWAWDPETLTLFAKHYETGEPLPLPLIKQMRASNEFGKGLMVSQQMFYAAVSLHYYDQNPTGLDTTELLKKLQKQYASFAYVPDTYFQTSFGHLDGYSAVYYTYMWSLVIAKDMLTAFKAKGMLNPEVSTKYRDAVQAAGGSKDAADLVKDFLGRNYDFKAYAAWLNQK